VHRDLVIIQGMRLGGTPQLAVLVVVIGHCDLPAVFIDIKYPPGIDMFHFRFQCALHHPDPIEWGIGIEAR
jgi:hypothetical protein